MNTATLEKNKQLARRFIDEVFNRKNYAILDEMRAPNLIEHEHEKIVFAPGGHKTIKWVIDMFLESFPDLQVKIEDLSIAEDEKVMVLSTWTGTHRKEFNNIPATDKKIALEVIDIFRFVDGKIVEHWAIPGFLELLLQLGAFPPSKPA